jgi:hypothetical protein
MIKKASTLEYQQRIANIYNMLLSGYTTADVIRYCDEVYKVGLRSSEKMIAIARERILEEGKREYAKEFALAIARLTNLYLAAKKEKRYNTCLGVQREINALCGLYPIMNPTVPDINIKIEGIERN